MPEQVGRCDNEAVSFRVHGFEGDERPDVPCQDTDSSSVPLSFTIPNLLFVIDNSVVCDLRVFLATVGDEQTVLLAIASFVGRGITGLLDDGDEPIESIDFLCV